MCLGSSAILLHALKEFLLFSFVFFTVDIHKVRLLSNLGSFQSFFLMLLRNLFFRVVFLLSWSPLLVLLYSQ